MKKHPRKAKPETPRPRRNWSLVLTIAGLALLAFLVYANSLANGFVGDDKDQLLQNPLVLGNRIAAAFGSGVWAFRGFQGNYYRPLPFVVYILVHIVAGFQAFAYHLVFVALHAITTVLVYFLAARLTGRERTALAAAVVFAVHPIHTEVVDWIASLPDLMVSLIVAAAVLWFARQSAAPRGREVAGHCALYLAALFSKETGVMLLPLLLGYELMYLRRPLRKLRENVPLYGGMVATFGIYAGARWIALGGLAPGQQTFYRLGPGEFALSVTVTAAHYLQKLVLPLDLNYFHIFHPTQSLTAGFLISALVLGAMAWLALRRETPPTVSYGILWIALTLAPALNLTGVGQNVFAERYLYLPSIAFAWITAFLWDGWAARQSALAWSAGLLVVCAAAWQTIERNPDWRDDFTLLRKTVAQSPAAGILHNNLAGVYIDRNDFDRALEEERLAVQMEPRSALFHKNLGLILMARDPRTAVQEFEEALRLQPSDVQVKQLLEMARRGISGR